MFKLFVTALQLFNSNLTETLCIQEKRIYKDYFQFMTNLSFAVLFAMFLILITFGFLRCPLVLVAYHA